MSYSLKNKTIALIALALAVMIVPCAGRAQVAPVAAPSAEAPAPTPISEDDDIFGLDEETEGVAETAPAVNAVEKTGKDMPAGNSGDSVIANNEPGKSGNIQDNVAEQSQSIPDDVDDFLNDVDENNELPTNNDVASPNQAPNLASNNAPANSDLLADTAPINPDVNVPKPTLSDKKEDAIPATEAPKSPFESFGNTILAKVDNDLFNQMSNIEKQTTLLNLEFKREELKNKVEALKAARARAKEEEEERRREAEERRKEREAERQAKIIAEQEKLKQREIELEKVRQARVLNEYMNEMLMINQQWVEKNAVLQSRIVELEKERIAFIKDFEKKSGEVYREISSVKKRAEAAVSTHDRVVASLNAQISQLRRSVIENEDRYKKLKEGNADNPFGGLNTLNAVDMSKEYAIMDITGKGDNIVAKIVNSEGTTFIVHKGSMLKGGEVVVAITDNYVAFENKGVKSYLYTGGSVMEFEPTVSFNDSDKMPEETEKASIKSEVRNVLGQKNNTKATSTAPAAPAKAVPVRRSQPSGGSTKRNTVSASSGMFD